MQKNILFFLVFLVAILVPSSAVAHERQVFNIGGVEYLFTVGSLGEPIVVDDKTGVDLRVKQADRTDPGNGNAPGAKPATGLEQTLKVELIAGDKKKVEDLSPAFNDPGAYKTTFFPTVQTTLTYRFFGEINKTPVDISFSCLPEGEARAPEDTASMAISDGVTRTLKVGSFGCPLAKESLGFPEDSASLLAMQGSTADLGATSRNFTTLALALGILAILLGGAALMKKR